MTKFSNSVGVRVPHVLLPKAGSDFYKWAVVACDQFTSQPDYWKQAADVYRRIGGTWRRSVP